MGQYLIQILVGILVFSVVLIVGLLISYLRSRKKPLDIRKVGVFEDDPLIEKPSEKTSVTEFLAKVGNFVSHGRPDAELWEQMIQAGFYNVHASAIFMGAKILLFLVGLVVSFVLVFYGAAETTPLPTQITIVLLGATVFLFMPNMYIWYRMKKRHDQIYRHLPAAVDLLEICVSSGLGLDMAWNIVADEMMKVCPVLSNAMSLTNFEMHLGVSRIDAMKHMADRTGVDELKSLAAILVQTDRFGTSIAETLQIFAKSIREERSFVAQETAEKMSVKMIIPMILFIFPAILIVILGPAMITILRGFDKF
jgi:tight adherence protein C